MGKQSRRKRPRGRLPGKAEMDRLAARGVPITREQLEAWDVDCEAVERCVVCGRPAGHLHFLWPPLEVQEKLGGSPIEGRAIAYGLCHGCDGDPEIVSAIDRHYEAGNELPPSESWFLPRGVLPSRPPVAPTVPEGPPKAMVLVTCVGDTSQEIPEGTRVSKCVECGRDVWVSRESLHHVQGFTPVYICNRCIPIPRE